MEGGYLRLTKKQPPPSTDSRRLELKRVFVKLSDSVKVPGTQKALYTQVIPSLSWQGKLANLFYKPQPLLLIVQLEDGSQKEFRLPSEMAKTGFLLSPLVESTEDFMRVLQGDPPSAEKKVKNFQVKPGGLGKSWNEAVEIVFYSY